MSRIDRSEGPGRAPTASSISGCQETPNAFDVVRLTAVARALADPIRLAMLNLMAQGRSCCGLPRPSERGIPGTTDPQGICVCELQECLSLAQSKASYHLRILREAGLTVEETRGKWTFHRIDEEGVADALDALRTLVRLQET